MEIPPACFANYKNYGGSIMIKLKRLLLIITLLVFMGISHNQVFANNNTMTEEEFHNLGKSSVFYDEFDYFLYDVYDIYFTKVGMNKNDFIKKVQTYGLWKNIKNEDFSSNDIIKDDNGNSEKVYMIRKIKDRLIFYTGVFENDKLAVSVVQFYSNDIKDIAPLYDKSALIYISLANSTEKTLKDYKVGYNDISMLINTDTQNIMLSINQGSFPHENEYKGNKYKYGFFISHIDKNYKL